MGALLVDRSHQPVTLTEAGNQMLEAGLQSLSRIERERSLILEAQSLPDKYVVTFGAQHSIGWRFYPAWLQALEEAYGPFLSRLRADNLPNCMRDLKRGDVDFVVAYQDANSAPTGAFESVVIGGDQLVPVCKPDADGRPVFGFDTPDIEMPYLRFDDTAPIGSMLKPLLDAKNLTGRLHTVYENSMAGALRIRARAGDGVAWLPKSLVKPDLDSQLLVRTGDPDWAVNLEIRLFRDLHHSNRLTRSIWSFLEVRQDVSLFPME